LNSDYIESNLIILFKITGFKNILYLLKKKGLSTQMELDEFIEICEIVDASSAILPKQCEKLDPKVFHYLKEAEFKSTS